VNLEKGPTALHVTMSQVSSIDQAESETIPKASITLHYFILTLPEFQIGTWHDIKMRHPHGWESGRELMWALWDP